MFEEKLDAARLLLPDPYLALSALEKIRRPPQGCSRRPTPWAVESRAYSASEGWLHHPEFSGRQAGGLILPDPCFALSTLGKHDLHPRAVAFALHRGL